MQDQAIKDRQWWDDYFSVGGGWEKNGGRRQTRIFAEQFTRRLEINRCASFSLLDVGCALGDALKHFSAVFPNASLHGIDFSETAIARCRDELKGAACLAVADIDSIAGHYDLIYCSNTLEHFPDYDGKARNLAHHCSRLCLLVPYEELQAGRPLRPSPSEHHQHTFYPHSYDFLLQEGLARNITTCTFACPGAWGWNARQRLKETLKNVFRPLVGRQQAREPRQIFYDIIIGEHP